MDLQAIYDFARTTLDSDDDEMPDTLMGVWVNAAEARIIDAIHEAERLFSNDDGITGDGLTQAFALTNVTEPRIVMGLTGGGQWQLEPIPHEWGLKAYPLNATINAPLTFGASRYWSMDDDGGTMWLWPAPNDGNEFQVTGLKVPVVTDVSDTTNVPQIPTKYHSLLGDYCVAKGAAMQQNFSMSSSVMSLFEGTLTALSTVDLRPAKAGVTTVGSVQLRQPSTPYGRLPWPWE